jgi:hypothetical protein
MRKRILLVAPAAALAFAFTTAAPASAHDAGPCNDAGGPGHSDYAQHHIVFNAHEGTLGAGGHKPGSHRGYSACLAVHD